MTGPAIDLRDAADIDLEEYAAFQRRAYRDLLARRGASDAHMSPEYYRWKYHPPDGVARIARVVDNGVTRSSSAMLPLRLTVNGRLLTGWHALDVGTVPEARGRGLFLATLRSLVESVPAGDVFFAFPNEGSIPSFRKLGCIENTILTTWVAPLVFLTGASGDGLARIHRFDPEHDTIAGHLDRVRPCVDRRSDYLNWRYVDHPINDYAAFVAGDRGSDGLCVVRRAHAMGRDLALVMELTGPTEAAQRALLAHAAFWARSEGLGTMALMSTTLSLATALRKLLAPVPSFLLPKRQVLVVRSGAEDAPSSATRWSLSTGDWDVF